MPLNTTLDDINENVLALTGTLELWQSEMEARLLGLEMWQATSAERWRGHEEVHQSLLIRTRLGNGLNAIATAVVAAFVWLVRGNN